MEKTWRWFGQSDKVTLDMLRQIGVEGIVTSLHHIKNGDVWPIDEIRKVQRRIAENGMRWSVVESLPVSEQIKYAGPDRDRLIDQYIVSLDNLGKAGIRTVCYNFMPVLDWARTDLEYPNPDGTLCLYFNKAEFAYFDIHILKRAGAEKDFDDTTLERVERLKATMTPEHEQKLVNTIIIKTQGFLTGYVSEDATDPVRIFNGLLALFDGVDRDGLRANLKYFLEAVMPVCGKYGIGMCIHPDDPPMQMLGLPRIVTCDEDIDWIMKAVPDRSNGLTFCAGSLSSGAHNDVTALAAKYADRTRFVHLRSTEVLPDGDFREASHLAGRADLVSLVRIFEKTDPTLPMRVDHAPVMLGDDRIAYNPGYPFHGRMLALGQVEGIMATVRREISEGIII